jgi:hypothetical protein
MPHRFQATLSERGRTMDDNSKWPPAGTFLAVGAAVGAGLVGLGYCLKLALPVLGTSLGLAIATATTGLATGAVATWVAPVAAVGVAATGTVVTVHLLVKVVDHAKDKPYEWTLPFRGAIAGILSELITRHRLPEGSSTYILQRNCCTLDCCRRSPL